MLRNLLHEITLTLISLKGKFNKVCIISLTAASDNLKGRLKRDLHGKNTEREKKKKKGTLVWVDLGSKRLLLSLNGSMTWLRFIW